MTKLTEFEKEQMIEKIRKSLEEQKIGKKINLETIEEEEQRKTKRKNETSLVNDLKKLKITYTVRDKEFQEAVENWEQKKNHLKLFSLYLPGEMEIVKLRLKMKTITDDPEITDDWSKIKKREDKNDDFLWE